MKNVLALIGSPRARGNSTLLLEEFLGGAVKAGAGITEIFTPDLQMLPCRGCLRCNLVKRCTLRDGIWEGLSGQILAADVIVVSSPIYFHHMPAALKNVIDRFRSFVHVKIEEHGLVHKPWHRWRKDFVLILTMGSPSPTEAMPVVELFEFMTTMLGEGNRLTKILGTGLAVGSQVLMTAGELETLYEKIGLPITLAPVDFEKNQALRDRCRQLGLTLGKGSGPAGDSS